jgi:hypothetical protein
LNALGYSSVEPIAPGGGGDRGQDIRFREGDTPGVALVTLDKQIRAKFAADLELQVDAVGVVALFCNVKVSTSMKLEFAKAAISKGYRLEVFDLERLRSLLDSTLKDVRRRYLGIDDEVAALLRSDVNRLLRFPKALPDLTSPATMIERILLDKMPRRLFDSYIPHPDRARSCGVRV